eukprot:3941988-Rhodomonas_salina.2
MALRASYVMCGTDMGCAVTRSRYFGEYGGGHDGWRYASVLRASYAMSGTDVVYRDTIPLASRLQYPVLT